MYTTLNDFFLALLSLYYNIKREKIQKHRKNDEKATRPQPLCLKNITFVFATSGSKPFAAAN